MKPKKQKEPSLVERLEKVLKDFHGIRVFVYHDKCLAYEPRHEQLQYVHTALLAAEFYIQAALSRAKEKP